DAADSAIPVEVQSGADLHGIDLAVTQHPPYRVSGRVVDPSSGRPPQRLNLELSLQDGPPGACVGNGVNPIYTPVDGAFEPRNMNAGAYFITASTPRPAPSIPPQEVEAMSPAQRNEFFRSMEAAELARPRVSLPLNVNADLDGIV